MSPHKRQPARREEMTVVSIRAYSAAIRLLVLLITLGLAPIALAENEPPSILRVEEPLPAMSCLAGAERDDLISRMETNIARLQASGIIPEPSLYAKRFTLLSFPLRAADHVPDPGVHYTWHFVDHDSRIGPVLDYNCGTRSHEVGYGVTHGGTDYHTWPFTWNKMYDSDVEVIACADGVIIYRQDGHPDTSYAGNMLDHANGVAVLHADGTRAIYIHMKRDSVTPKQIGERVVRGEYLGVVGSSGNSLSPHLHLECLDNMGRVIDPYDGDCDFAVNGGGGGACRSPMSIQP